MSEPRYVLSRSYRAVYMAWVHALQADPTADVWISDERHGRVFTHRPYTTCSCSGPHEHVQHCRVGAPNLHIPQFDLKVYWFGAAMRGAWCNRQLTEAQFRGVLDWVLRVEAGHSLPAGTTA